MLWLHMMQLIFVINVLFCYKFVRVIICFHKGRFFVRTIVFIWLQFPKKVRTLEPEDMRMWEYQQARREHERKDMRMWGCKDTNKHTKYMSLRTRRCEDIRLQASTHKPEDVRIQGCKWGHMNLRIWGCKDARIQASA